MKRISKTIILVLILNSCLINLPISNAELAITGSELLARWNEIYPNLWEFHDQISGTWNYTGYDNGTWKVLDNVTYNGKIYDVVTNYTGRWNDTFTANWIIVCILYDPDDSIISSIRALAEINETEIMYPECYMQNLTFTGDEIFVSTFVIFDKGTSQYNWTHTYYWYNESAGGIRCNPPAVPAGHWLETYTVNQSYVGSWSWAWFGYDISEGWVLKAYTEKSPTERFANMGHFFAGMQVWNDTNKNGVMDVNMTKIWEDWDGDGQVDDWEVYPELVNEEVLYYVWITDAVIGTFSPPTATGGRGSDIVWGFEIKNVESVLIPFGNIWTGYFIYDGNVSRNGIDPLPAKFDLWKLDFTFSLTNGMAKLKLNNYMSDWNITNTLKGLGENIGLALDYYSWFEQVQYSYDVIDVNATKISPDQNSTCTDYFLWQIGGENVAKIDFVGEKYFWNKTKYYDAKGVQIPLWTFQAQWGGETSLAPMTNIQISLTCYYYATVYPTWGGWSIEHDPVYITYLSNWVDPTESEYVYVVSPAPPPPPPEKPPEIVKKPVAVTVAWWEAFFEIRAIAFILLILLIVHMLTKK